MNIAIIGTGYVGLVSGTCFADSGNNVTCVDIDEKKVKTLREGNVPIYEPGLEAIFDRSIRENRLHFTTDMAEAVTGADIVFLCLPTPPGGDGQADLSAVMKVAGQLGGMLTDYTVIVNKSTVPVGTADRVREAIAEHADPELFDVVSNPEFLREGAAVEDFMKPERVVIGTGSERAAEIMTTLYEPFVRSGNPIIVMDERSSELTKYAANAMLATKITFMNEIANICERVGANVDNVRRGIGTDSRIGKRFLFAGIGYGGSCFPKDVQAIHYTAAQNGYDFKILDSVMKVNESQKLSIVRKMEAYYGTNDFSGKTFGVWGLSFKPETDDIREAPALYVADELVKQGARLIAYDPEAIGTFKRATTQRVLDATTFVHDQKDALDDIDALIICTEWNEFRRPTVDHFKDEMKQPVIFDGRNLYDLDRARNAGITYISVGRPVIEAKELEAV
ncbi:UDP-glucose/GDP-mannose dehydrogenase family protein [Aliifodinibius sp. S!AR15-10]|uniref:UDP-glucose dehydrogenase family protein n=1 Tax=Aliifodinibius sp. S!AR15-10 TaxID=2950437 RepID=UPI0028636CAF|nr:UDP-glucose/GDP-mannose dehydrogenase family protein [Aliifodinibius sp. S!AR15-10]MDR8393386.1 UDP-glucose/GDP-mannose dehydrogenase family protein [Aliifodinibius sp. S!AR15-10]